jgi:hypothetical protein
VKRHIGWPPFVDMRCGTIWRPGGLVVATGLCERTCSASYRQWTRDGQPTRTRRVTWPLLSQ